MRGYASTQPRSNSFGSLTALDSSEETEHPEPSWTTRRAVLLDLPILRLHQFGSGNGPPTLIVAPYALHGAVITDLAPGHSLVERLLVEGLTNLLVLEWKSATPDMRFLGIDDYLAHLCAVVDDLGSPPALVGLCQGGWLSLMFAARFPQKVSKIVLAGAPVDLDAAPSAIGTATREVAPAVFKALVQENGGLIFGKEMLKFWGVRDPEPAALAEILQVELPSASLIESFRTWHGWTVDLPGTYYLQAVERLFRLNDLARGAFVGLGRRLELSDVRVPAYLLAADSDEVTPWQQVFAARRLLGSPPDQITTALSRGGHLSLFVGADNLRGPWRNVARWLEV